MSSYNDIVVVTLNHRLNLLGYLNLSEYGEEYKYSANHGMADIVAALQWIRENIEAFGGDPENVTIFGQSGGGGKVAALLQIPAADGLFHKAIIQSGVTRGIMEGYVDRSKEMAAKVLCNLGITKENIKEIETLPYYKLARAVSQLGPRAGMSFSPVKDGEYYMGDIFENEMTEHAKTVPVMVGTVLGEFTNNFNRTIGDGRKNRWSEEERIAYIREAAGENADKLISAFKAAYPEKNIADVLFTDPMFRAGAVEYAKIRAEKAAAPTFNYLFALESDLYGGTVPWHNAEIPYVFRNADYLEASYTPGITEWLQDIVTSCWASFARSGIPAAIGMCEWEATGADKVTTLIFDREIRLVKGHDEELIGALQGIKLNMTDITRRKSTATFGGGPRV